MNQPITISDEELLDELKEVAIEAGAAIMAVYTSDEMDVTYKEENGRTSPLTRADTEANNIIIARLKTLTPDIPILSEETKAEEYETRKSWKKFWLIDPLDGTKEFIKKSGEFTVNIALIEDGSPQMGVVYAPVLKSNYYALKGHGAFKDVAGTTVELCTADYRDEPLRVVASLSHRGPELEDFFAKIEKLGDVSAISMGSSLKLCLVAEGSAHLYPRLGPTMEWDTGAAHCVVECAGGSVTDLQGKPLQYNKENLLNPFFMVTGNPAYPWEGLVEKS
jgi:3'(2'), 5'-bisphosphate nucleotidase